jgi:prepilin-type N-terminal cleavage/methylation domain-containing protein
MKRRIGWKWQGCAPPVLGVRAGFTLVELLVAIAIGGLVVLTVHRLFGTSTDHARRLDAHRQGFERAANARRWLADAFGSLDVGQGEPGPFLGGSNGVEFSTWLLTGRGWHEAERVGLAVRDGRLIARLRGGEVVLADSVASAEFEYLVEYGESAPWLPGWRSVANAPLAVRIRLERASARAGGTTVDTLLFVIGARG